MKTMIYCKPTSYGVHSFFMVHNGKNYYLFSQNYRRGVHKHYSKGLVLNEAMNYAKAHGDSSIQRTITKLPIYIKYIEKEYEIEVLEKTKRKSRDDYFCASKCA